MMSIRKQGRAEIASASGQNRIAEFEHSQTVLEGLRKDLEAAVERLRISDDLVRELSARLLDRHDQLRRLRSASNGFRGAV